MVFSIDFLLFPLFPFVDIYPRAKDCEFITRNIEKFRKKREILHYTRIEEVKLERIPDGHWFVNHIVTLP